MHAQLGRETERDAGGQRLAGGMMTDFQNRGWHVHFHDGSPWEKKIIGIGGGVIYVTV
jgi:hypothetical protein